MTEDRDQFTEIEEVVSAIWTLRWFTRRINEIAMQRATWSNDRGDVMGEGLLQNQWWEAVQGLEHAITGLRST